MAGPVEEKGVWNKKEWLPSLVASSIYLGAVPETLPGQGDVCWIPVDILSRVIVEIVEADVSDSNDEREEVCARYYHLVNPQEGSWGALVPVLGEYYSLKKGDGGREMEIVSFGEWVERLERSAEREDVDVQRNPAVKLLDAYRGMRNGGDVIRLDTREARRKSESMRGLKGVDEEWMRLWLEQWEF